MCIYILQFVYFIYVCRHKCVYIYIYTYMHICISHYSSFLFNIYSSSHHFVICFLYLWLSRILVTTNHFIFRHSQATFFFLQTDFFLIFVQETSWVFKSKLFHDQELFCSFDFFLQRSFYAMYFSGHYLFF